MMKVTALLPDDLILEVRKLSGGRNITDSLLIALSDYVAHRKIHMAILKVKERPLRFRDGFSARRIRRNRKG
jgi:hypothetical protein